MQIELYLGVGERDGSEMDDGVREKKRKLLVKRKQDDEMKDKEVNMQFKRKKDDEKRDKEEKKEREIVDT